MNLAIKAPTGSMNPHANALMKHLQPMAGEVGRAGHDRTGQDRTGQVLSGAGLIARPHTACDIGAKDTWWAVIDNSLFFLGCVEQTVPHGAAGWYSLSVQADLLLSAWNGDTGGEVNLAEARHGVLCKWLQGLSHSPGHLMHPPGEAQKASHE